MQMRTNGYLLILTLNTSQIKTY